MKAFEQLEKEFKPLIISIIKKLSLYKDFDNYYQIGRIALWEATTRFDPTKGVRFSTYAYTLIRGKMLDHLKKEKQIEGFYESLTNGYEQTLFHPSEHEHVEEDIISSYCQGLTDNQRKWVRGRIIEEKSYQEIAGEYSVSVEAVKSWGKQALKRLKAGTIL